jgi:hypothetical protein
LILVYIILCINTNRDHAAETFSDGTLGQNAYCRIVARGAKKR